MAKTEIQSPSFQGYSFAEEGGALAIATDSGFSVGEMHMGDTSAIALTGQWVKIIATEVIFG